jgi:hypothetical protein
VATKADFSAEEWDVFRKAPTLAGLMVMWASPSGPLGVMKESAALAQSLREPDGAARTELLRALQADLQDHYTVYKLEAADPDAVRSEALGELRKLAAILRVKASEEEAAEVKEWVLRAARRVAVAARERTVLGFGGVAVSREEETALALIEVALR